MPKISSMPTTTLGLTDLLTVVKPSGSQRNRQTTVADLVAFAGFPNVKGSGAVGDGVTNDYAAIQAILDGMTTGGTLYFPSGTYYLGTSLDAGTKEMLYIMSPDARFSGTGSPPTTVTNTDVEFSAPIGVMMRPEGNDGFGMVVDLDCQDTFTGEHVAGYFGIRGPSGGAGYIWGINTLVDLQPGYTDANAVGIEIDVANYAQAGLGVGLLVTGLGDYTCGYGVNITRADTDTDWSHGLVIQHSSIGIIVDGTDVVVPSFGLKIDHLQEGHVQLVPTDDTNPTNVMFGVANAAEGQHNFSISKSGSFLSRGAMSMVEMTAPAGVANQAVLFAQDNGAGKTQLMVIFGSGAAQEIKIEA